MRSILPCKLLILALRADAAVSAAVAIFQLVLLDWLTEHLQLPRGLLLGTAVFLLGYALMLVALYNRRSVWRALILFVVAGNAGWALACLALLAESIVAPSGLGVAFVLVQTATVLGFAALEFSGLRQSAIAHSAPASVHGALEQR